jgi:hypothetical protein
MAKKRTTKKKMSTGGKIAVGVVVVAGGWLAWEFLLKDMFKRPEPVQAPTLAPSTVTTPDPVVSIISSAQNTTPNQAGALSPLGTAREKLRYNSPMVYGSKGEEVKVMQIILNNIAKLYNANPISTDGVWGPETTGRVNKLFGGAKTVTLKRAFELQDWHKNNYVNQNVSGVIQTASTMWN